MKRRINNKQFDPGALRYLADASSANALLPVFSYGNAGEKNWFLMPDTRAVSFDRRYVVRQDWNDPETPISVDDLGSGNSFQLTRAPYAALASLDGSWIVDLAGKDVYDRFGWNPALLGVLWRPK